ncbi:MAG: ABC transporter permease [Gemmatimonadales bacterium]
MTRPALVVAGWEFRRYFKWKDQFVSLAMFFVVGLAFFAFSKIATGRGREITVGVVGIELTAPAEGRLRFVPAAADSAAGTEALRAGDLAGILRRGPGGGYELVVEKEPRYEAELTAILAETVRRERLVGSGIDEAVLAQALAPPALAVRFVDPGKSRRGRGELILAGILMGIMLMTVFTSMAYLLTGITGEKQLRVTESIISAIRPQAWIDGKVLGLSGYALTGVVNMGIGGAITWVGVSMATDFTLPAVIARPGVIAVLLLFTVLGLLLWNAFFAAIASTIDDPNTSSRGGLMMLPALPVVLGLAVMRDPDSLLSRGLALIPFTSVPALPVRLVLSDPGVVEIVVSGSLLVAAIWLTRRLAGRIFEVGMLLYGKEPSWGEIARWVRR